MGMSITETDIPFNFFSPQDLLSKPLLNPLRIS